MRPNPNSVDHGRAACLDPPCKEAGSASPAPELGYSGRNDCVGLAQATLPTTTKSGPTSGVSFAEAVGSTKPGLDLAKAWDRKVGVDKGSGSCGVGSRVAAWVSTGDAVALQYQGVRKEAAELAR